MFPCLIKIVHKDGAPSTLLTHTENVSLGGVCVIVRRHLEMFMPISVEMDLLDCEDTLVCNGKVVWTVRRKATEEFKPSFYDTGIEFTDMDESGKARLEKMIVHLLKTKNNGLVV
ncbi:MAG: PilZ domain-containing protein [Candidatus Omnitrophica bacterium]|nr:PilZ domain-containing protein [Candidatus Omnitrophota bacterium]